MSFQAIKQEVIKLDRAKQADLMHFLIELLVSEKFQLSDEWKKELADREEALKAGTSIGRPARDVIAKYTMR